MAQPRFKQTHPDQRNCALYRIYVLDPRTNFTTVCLGYVGETAREPFTRFLEHLYEQPFGDTIVGKPHVDPRVFPNKQAVWRAERAAVEAERPLYNDEWNRGNPDRIPIPVARRQREERDRARGVESPTWSRPTQVQAQRREWSPRQRKAALLAGLWMVLAVVGWVGAVHSLHATLAHGARDGVVGATALYVAAWWNRKPRRRRPARRSRRRRR